MWLENKIQSFENTRFGSMSWMIIIHCCLAGLAAAMALENDNIFVVSLLAAVAMGVNTFFIAQTKAKWCVLGFYTSVAISSLSILWFLIA